MSDKRIVLETAAFLDSAHALRITGAPTAEIREITQRFLTAVYDSLGKEPRLLDGEEIGGLLAHTLPAHFGVRDPLAAKTEEVLRAYLAFLEETEMVPEAFEQRLAFDRTIEAFGDAVASGVAHRDGVVRTRAPKTVVHRAEKTGRNDPCPCGSGKKFKRCCMHLGR